MKMNQFRCVVRFDGRFWCDVPSIRPLEEMGLEMCEIPNPIFGESMSKDSRLRHYEVVIGTENVPVTSWEDVHPSEWSEELRQLNQSYV